jgi:DNA-binding transcriptional MerR regulator
MDRTEGAQMTIDELAQRTRLTVRNIRAYQSRGLVQPPEIRGRTGYYGDDHVARIELIRELQSEGFNLEAIRRLIEGAGGETEEVLRFTQAVREPFEQETSREVGLEELSEMWGDRADPRILERALELGLLRELGGGRYEERSPRLGRAGLELARLGIDPETGLDVIAAARRHAEGVADEYVQLFLNEIWKPFVAEGRPQEKWPEVRDALERLRPLAGEVLLAVFGLAMTEATERAFGRELDKIEKELRRDEAA